MASQKLHGSAALIGLLFFCASANATLSEADSEWGVATLTVDSESGLEWLDLTVTANRSYDDVAAQLSPGGEFDGFRHAFIAEVQELWLNAGIVDITTHDPPVTGADYSAANFAPVEALMALIGQTFSALGNPLSEGLTAEGSPLAPDEKVVGELNLCIAPAPCTALGIPVNTALASLGPNTQVTDEALIYIGHFLVRATELDSDGDGFLDSNDNCLLEANTDQRDTDGDGIGNRCDPDFDGNCMVNFVDLGAFKAEFLMSGDLDSDFDGDGNVNFIDLGVIKAFFLMQPGPSGVDNSCAAR